MRTAKHLGVADILRLIKPGRHSIGSRLYLEITPTGLRNWMVRYSRDGRPTWLSLGKADPLRMADSLRDARERAREVLDAAARGDDPKAARRFAARLAGPTGTPVARVTFASLIDTYIRKRQAGWTNPDYARSTEQYLRTWTATLGTRAVNSVTTADIRTILEPHWVRTNPTATRIRIHIEAAFALAAAEGLRTEPNPATLAALKPLLGAVKREEGHHAALPWKALPGLLTRLEGITGDKAREALALRWCILTAVRTNEAIGARWTEIDRERKTWRIPAVRMKRDKPHAVPLSAAALAVLDACSQDGELVFGHLPHSALYELLMGPCGYQPGQASVHGLRSGFADWCADEKACPVDVADAALAHSNKRRSRTTKAYLRTDYFSERVGVMERWGAFLTFG